MKGFGILLLILGVLILLVGFGMDTTVPTELGERRVHNIGLMNERQNTILLGGVISIIGAIFIGFGSRGASTVAQSSDSSGTKSCPYCAELIKKQAVVCRFCNRDLAADTSDKPTAAQEPETEVTDYELMVRHGISYSGDKYVYKGQRYEKLEDAVAYARHSSASERPWL